jgi:malate synthase
LVRPRGLHLDERHIIINNEKASGSLVDFGLYVFHNTQTMHNELQPYFLLTKIRALFRSWWNKVLNLQEYLGANGTFKQLF